MEGATRPTAATKGRGWPMFLIDPFPRLFAREARAGPVTGAMPWMSRRSQPRLPRAAAERVLLLSSAFLRLPPLEDDSHGAPLFARDTRAEPAVLNGAADAAGWLLPADDAWARKKIGARLARSFAAVAAFELLSVLCLHALRHVVPVFGCEDLLQVLPPPCPPAFFQPDS